MNFEQECELISFAFAKIIEPLQYNKEYRAGVKIERRLLKLALGVVYKKMSGNRDAF